MIKEDDLPQVKESGISSVGIIGAGMMGAGLAAVFAKAGFKVVLKDIAQVNLKKALERCRLQCSEENLQQINFVMNNEQLSKCDLIIEAVFENSDLKHKIIQEVEPLLSPHAIWASNTSALPISELASKSIRPQNFIGLHFFSPPEKMQLVEIICGEKTSNEILACCLNFVQQIKKFPIVVSDAYGFYTTRIFFSYIMEGAQLVAEGYNPLLIEKAAKDAGMVVGPLKIFDEVSLALILHALPEAQRHGQSYEPLAVKLIRKMVKLGRAGKAAQKGFYDYDGKNRQIWPCLRDLSSRSLKENHEEYLQKRLMLVQCAQVAQAIDLGIIRCHQDAETGAVFGIGFASQTGGPLTFMNRYGLKKVVHDLQALEKECGERYKPARVLLDKVKRDENFVL